MPLFKFILSKNYMKIEPRRAKQFQIGKEKKKETNMLHMNFGYVLRFDTNTVLLAWLSFELSYKM